MNIVVTKRSDDFHAALKDNPAVWGCGKTIDAAIGDLIRSHQHRLGITILHKG